MAALTYHTAGESHGPAVVTLVNGLPAGLQIDVAFIDAELRRRQGGYGRGGRQRIESDAVTFLAGVRLGRTTGGPLVMQTPNRDSRLDDLDRTPAVSRPRPGHADLAGSVKWLTTDCRDALERASARETVGRTAAGALARCLLREFGITTFGFVRGLLDAVPEVILPDTDRGVVGDEQALRRVLPDPAAHFGVGVQRAEHVAAGHVHEAGNPPQQLALSSLAHARSPEQ